MSVSLGREASKTCFYCRHYKDFRCGIAKRKKAPDAPACGLFKVKSLEEFFGGTARRASHVHKSGKPVLAR